MDLKGNRLFILVDFNRDMILKTRNVNKEHCCWIPVLYQSYRGNSGSKCINADES